VIFWCSTELLPPYHLWCYQNQNVLLFCVENWSLNKFFMVYVNILLSFEGVTTLLQLSHQAKCGLLPQRHLSWFLTSATNTFLTKQNVRKSLSSLINISVKCYKIWCTFGKVIAEIKSVPFLWLAVCIQGWPQTTDCIWELITRRPLIWQRHVSKFCLEKEYYLHFSEFEHSLPSLHKYSLSLLICWRDINTFLKLYDFCCCLKTW